MHLIAPESNKSCPKYRITPQFGTGAAIASPAHLHQPPVLPPPPPSLGLERTPLTTQLQHLQYRELSHLTSPSLAHPMAYSAQNPPASRPQAHASGSGIASYHHRDYIGQVATPSRHPGLLYPSLHHFYNPTNRSYTPATPRNTNPIPFTPPALPAFRSILPRPPPSTAPLPPQPSRRPESSGNFESFERL